MESVTDGRATVIFRDGEEMPENETVTLDTTPEVQTEELGENGQKALQAEREARKEAGRKNASLQAQIDEINKAKLSAQERAEKERDEAKASAAELKVEALRWKIAAKHGISDDDAETFLTGSSEEVITKQAERVSALSKTPATPKADPSQGARGKASPGNARDAFAEALNGSN